jgi:hypothetical protein
MRQGRARSARLRAWACAASPMRNVARADGRGAVAHPAIVHGGAIAMALDESFGHAYMSLGLDAAASSPSASRSLIELVHEFNGSFNSSMHKKLIRARGARTDTPPISTPTSRKPERSLWFHRPCVIVPCVIVRPLRPLRVPPQQGPRPRLHSVPEHQLPQAPPGRPAGSRPGLGRLRNGALIRVMRPTPLRPSSRLLVCPLCQYPSASHNPHPHWQSTLHPPESALLPRPAPRS